MTGFINYYMTGLPICTISAYYNVYYNMYVALTNLFISINS